MLLLALLALLQAAPPRARATVEGTVVRRDTAAPVADAGISLTKILQGDTPKKEPPRAYTDAQGRFHIDNLEPGRYRLTVSAPGYVTQEFGQRAIEGVGIPFDLTAGQTRKDADVRLIPAGTVSGRVRGTAGRPVPGVRVQLMQRIYFAGSQAEKHMALPVSETDSDDLGEYRFYGVKPGRYVVLAGNGISEEFILSGNWVISGIPDTFFPGTYELEEADVIAVLPGAAVEDINFTLPSSQRYSIRGRLKDLATGQPPETILLNLGTHFGDDSVQVGPPRRLKYDAASGEFEIAGLLPGKYDVEEDNLGLLWYGIRVVDRDVDLSSIAVSAYPSFRVAQAQPSLRITGRITVEGTLPAGKSIDGIRVQVGKHSFNVSKDGTFQATVPTGEHGVRVSPQPESGSMEAPLAGLYLKRVLFNGVGSRDRALFQADGAMEIVLSANGGKVDGVLRNDEGVIAGIKVVLVPADRERFDLFKTAVTDERGHYSIADIPPGSYRLFAWDSLEPNSYFDPDVLKSDEEVGKGIEIRELSRATVDLRLIPFRANR